MSDVNLDVGLGRSPRPAQEIPESRPFRIALLGDFSGRGSRSLHSTLEGRRPISIDPGNFEEVMERLRVELHLPSSAGPVVLRFRTLDDFHPDELYANADVFQSFHAARTQLAKAPIPAQPAAPMTGSLLDQVLEATPAARKNDWDAAIHSIVAPHMQHKPGAEQVALLEKIGSATAEAMRVILGHPQFQELEAAWRSVFLLLSHLETGTDLTLELIDATAQEVMDDALASNEKSNGLRRLLVEQPTPWTLVAGLYTFNATDRDCLALTRLAGMAEAAGAPFVAAAHTHLAGCRSIAGTPDPDDWNDRPELGDAWRTLRSRPNAQWIGLAFPRFLLRLPYGASTSPVDSFPFEEMPSPPDHDRYLWGNAAIVSAALMGQMHQQGGPGNRLSGVPVHTFRKDGEVDSTPPAEVWLTERDAARLLDAGLMPLASVKNSDSVHLLRFQSIAHPSALLAGSWH